MQMRVHSILMIFVDGKLGFAKPGDEKWTLVGKL
jgi:hypothetical protein